MRVASRIDGEATTWVRSARLGRKNSDAEDKSRPHRRENPDRHQFRMTTHLVLQHFAGDHRLLLKDSIEKKQRENGTDRLCNYL